MNGGNVHRLTLRRGSMIEPTLIVAGLWFVAVLVICL